jgi:hypothetical protein
MHATVKELWVAVFYVGSVHVIYFLNIILHRPDPVWRRVRIPPPQSLRVVRGDIKGTQCPGV